jgi:hypothetical protein
VSIAVREADDWTNGLIVHSATLNRPFHGLVRKQGLFFPAMNRWAIFGSPLRGLLGLKARGAHVHE